MNMEFDVQKSFGYPVLRTLVAGEVAANWQIIQI